MIHPPLLVTAGIPASGEARRAFSWDWRPFARNVVFGLITVLPLAFALKVAAAVVTGGVASVSIPAILDSFTNAFLLVFAGINAAFFVVEAAALGWRDCSFRRLVVAPGHQARGDTFCILMTYSGATAAVITLLSLGMVDAAVAFLGAQSATGPLTGVPAWIAAPLLYLSMTFFNYWTHRLMHTRFFWPLHAYHHSAREFNVFNANRASLLDVATVMIGQAIPAALLGASPDAILFASLIAGNEGLAQHSNLRGLAWLERFGINPPKAHRIHHAIDPKYHGHNFADMICIWDKLFGTFISSKSVEGEPEMGVEDPHGIYISERPLRDLVLTHWLWARNHARSLAAAARGSATSTVTAR